MDSKADDFREPFSLINDDLAPPFSSPIHNQLLNEPIEEHRSNTTYKSALSIQSNIHMSNDLINKDNQIEEENVDKDLNEEKILIQQLNYFIEQIKINQNSFDINEFHLIIQDLNQIFKYLQVQSFKVQQITTFLQNQLISVKHLGEKLSQFNFIGRCLIISALNIRQNTNNLTLKELDMLLAHFPNEDSITSDIIKILFDQNGSSISDEDYKNRLEYSRSIIHLLKQTTKIEIEIKSLNELLTKSVLSKNERYKDIQQSFSFPTNIFNSNPLYDLFHYQLPIPIQTNKQDVYIRTIHGILKQNDIQILSIENPKHPLAQMNYNDSQKYSYIFDIEFKRVITPVHKLTIAIPCFQLPSQFQSTNLTNRSQQIHIRCKRLMDPLIHIPALLETHNDITYAIFRLTYALSPISVEAVLIYPFEVLRLSNEGVNYVYTSEYSSTFRIETAKNYFSHCPRVRMIPLNNEILQCIKSFQRDDKILSSSDLIEFDWSKESKSEGNISLTIELTRDFNLINQTDEDIEKRRRKAKLKIVLQRQKFEQEKYDEAGGSLSSTPRSSQGLTSPTLMSHLPTISTVNNNDQQKENLNITAENTSPDLSSIKNPLKWKLDRFNNENASIILLAYKNRKWKNWNHFSTITSTNDKNTFIINLTNLVDRLILIRCWPESTTDGKFDKLAEKLWSLTSMKLYSCVLARDSSSVNTLTHYGLVIVPLEKQNLAEQILEKRNYTQFIYQDENNTSEYQSNRLSIGNSSKYVQFCASEGTYVRIVPMGNIDIHEKSELSFRLHGQYPFVIEFDLYPIDIYRQKTEQHFIGTLNIYQINTLNSNIGSTSSTLTTNSISSRRSSASKDLELMENLTVNSSARTSISGPETISNIGGTSTRAASERLTVRDFSQTTPLCEIHIRLPKTLFNLPSTQSNTIPIPVPDYFTKVTQVLNEGKREFAEALTIHPALINPLLTDFISLQRDNGSQSNRISKLNIPKDANTINEQKRLENETLFKWLKRQYAFKTDQTLDSIISALIHVGRVDLAYMFKLDFLTNQCHNL